MVTFNAGAAGTVLAGPSRLVQSAVGAVLLAAERNDSAVANASILNSYDKNVTTTMLPPITMHPALPASVHTPVTIFIAVTCLLVALLLCFQLVRIHLYGNRRLSVYYACVWMSLAWAGLRTYLCFQYAVHDHVASTLPFPVYVILFVLPVVLQFATFSLVTLYFASVLQNTQNGWLRRAWPWLTRITWILVNVGVAVVSVVSAWRLNDETERPKQANDLRLRVLVTEVFSIVNVLALCFVVYRIKVAVRTARTVLEGYGATINQVIVFTAEVFVLFVSRFVYNMIAIGSGNVETWGYRWTFLSDHADRAHDDGTGYIFFVMALFLWEICPVCVVGWFFWVRPHAGYTRLQQQHHQHQGRAGGASGPAAVYYEDLSEGAETEDEDDFRDLSHSSDYLDVGIGVNSSSQRTPGLYGSYGATSYSSNY